MSSPSLVMAIADIRNFEDLVGAMKNMPRLASMAINKSARDTRTDAARRMSAQVRFPARYLSGEEGRLKVTNSSPHRLLAEIRARQRPTSLARFVTNPGAKPGNLRVAVSKISAGSRFRGGFLMKLKNGNVGFGVRLKPGETLGRHGSASSYTWNGITFVYGPSVDQVFNDVRHDVAPEAVARVEREIMRLIDLQR